MKKCSGCGAKFQTENKNGKGFVKNLDHAYCFRCFNLKNFNLNVVNIDDEAIDEMIMDIKQYSHLAVVVDIYGFSFLNELDNYGLNKKPIVLFINKVDLLPKSINERRIENWIIENYDSLNILKIIFISANKKFNIDHGINTLRKLNCDIPIIGRANVGKSSLINAMKKGIDPLDNTLVTISNYPGTTLDKVEWKVSDKFTIIDTPGLTYDSDFISKLSKESLSLFFPKRETKPTTYQLNSGQSIFVNGFILVNFKNINPISVTFYFSNEFYLHRCKTSNVENLISEHRGVDVIVPPMKEELTNIEYETRIFKISNSFSEIEFSSFGWLDIHTEEEMEVEVEVPASCITTLRKAIYKEISE